MSVVTKLRGLFGWSGAYPPVDKVRRSAELNNMQDAYGYNPYSSYSSSVKPPQERRRKYDLYDEMDEETIASVLDAYAEDSTQTDREKQAPVWIEAEDSQVKKILDALFDRLSVSEYVEAICRDVAKYGDDFAELDIEDKIVGWDWRDPRDVERIENRQGTLIGFEETILLRDVAPLLDGTSPVGVLSNGAVVQGVRPEPLQFSHKPWDMVHFRLYRRKRESKQKFRNIYGTSILAGAERISKQVKILDDMLMVRRLTKTLDTRVYKIDVGRSGVEEEIQILKRWRNSLKRGAFVDPTGNTFDSPFDPFTFQEDLFWPVTENSKTSVDVIPGQPNVADIVDVEHFRDKQFGVLRAPKGYFGFEGDINAKATLSTQDMKWGRACNSLQRSVRNGLTRLCQIELALHSIDPVKAKFNVRMVTPSVLEDLSRLEAIQTFVDVAERMVSLGEHLNLDQDSWREHILRSVIGMSSDDIDKFLAPQGIEPVPPLPGDVLGVNDVPDEGGEPANRLVEKVRSILLSKYGTSSERVVNDRAIEEELPTEANLKKEFRVSSYKNKIVPVDYVRETSEKEDSDDESDL